MGHKRKAINHFIENELVSEVISEFDQVFGQDLKYNSTNVKNLKEQIISSLGNVFDNEQIDSQYISLPIVQKYLKAKEDIQFKERSIEFGF
jgi:hypothetical protein